MAQQFEIIAKTFMGLESVLAKELAQLGANDVQVGRRMVSFKGDKELLYRANFQLHTAIRILKPIKHFRALSADDVYEGVKDIDWSEYIANDKTFAVDSVVFSEEFLPIRLRTLSLTSSVSAQVNDPISVLPIQTSVCTSISQKTSAHSVSIPVANRFTVVAIVRNLLKRPLMRYWQQV